MAKPRSIPHFRAFELQEDIGAWMNSDRYRTHLREDYLSLLDSLHAPRTLSRDAKINIYGDDIAARADSVTGSVVRVTPIFCSSDFTLMASIMTEAAPVDILQESDLPADTGLLVFQEPISLPASGPQDRPLAAVRAMSWLVHENDRGYALETRCWSETRNSPHSLRIPGRGKLYDEGVHFTPLTRRPEDSTDATLVKLLHSCLALLKSPLTRDTSEPRNAKITPRTKRSPAVDSIRRVYLRNPEHARYEAEEAVAEREGRAPVRAHWVRGHWRNQPYPKTGEVKGIWIDGYIKGNPEHGTVSTRKLHVARASAAEVRELVGAAA